MKKIISILSLSLLGSSISCDPTSTTRYVLQNSTEDDLSIFMKWTEPSGVEQDTIFSIVPNEVLIYASVEKLGKNNFDSNFQSFIQFYDSIIAIRSDTIFSQNFIDESDWIFTTDGEKVAEFKLIIDETDF